MSGAALRHEMQRHGRLRAETRRERVPARQVLERPAHTFLGAHAFERLVGRVEQRRLLNRADPRRTRSCSRPRSRSRADDGRRAT